ncbi:MAG: oligosaccharide flippase family protein, partial [Clostridia bacterium]|nr:oligosaccharide flippase family protein [Clostridia bacterium]
MNKTVKSFFTVSGFAVATRSLSFLFKMWMSRSLGAEAVGLYQISLSIILLLFSLTAGAPTVLSRKVAGAKGDISKQNSYVSSSLIIGLSTGVMIVILACLFHKQLHLLFADDRCVKLFLIMLPTLITSTIYASLRSWFWGQKKFLTFSSTELFEEVVRIAVASILA